MFCHTQVQMSYQCTCVCFICLYDNRSESYLLIVCFGHYMCFITTSSHCYMGRTTAVDGVVRCQVQYVVGNSWLQDSCYPAGICHSDIAENDVTSSNFSSPDTIHKKALPAEVIKLLSVTHGMLIRLINHYWL